MLEAIKACDESLFLFLNAQHNSFLDSLMWLFSEKFFWAPLYVWFLWLLYRKYPKHFWTVLITIALLIITTDQLCNLSKESVMRLRPTHEPHVQTLVHTVNGYTGGMYGFYSGHAANAFGLALFMIVIFGKTKKYIIPVAIVYSILTAYSRIYLGVHYPLDILTGAFVGAILGTGFAVAHSSLRMKYLSSPKHN